MLSISKENTQLRKHPAKISVHLKNYGHVFETLQGSNNSRGHSNFCINENYLMLIIIIKHNSLNCNNISVNKLKYQEYEDICNIQKSYPKIPRNTRALLM